MTVNVILDGQMGRIFGRKHELAAKDPIEALQMVDALKGGVFSWIRDNLNVYAGYIVTCKDKLGKVYQLSAEEVRLKISDLVEIRFTPHIMGSGGKGMSIGMIILGVVLLVVSIFFPPAAAGYFGMAGLTQGVVFMAGLGAVMGGMVGLLTPQPKFDGQSATKNKSSYYFNGPENTIAQGLPVPVIYGKCLVGSQAISASYTVNDITVDKTGKIKTA